MRPGWPTWLLLCAALAVPFAASTAAAAERSAPRLTVVLSADEPVYRATWESFRDTLQRLAGPALPFGIELITLNDGRPDAALPSADAPDLVIPIGAHAARFARDHLAAAPVFSILITRDAHEAIWPRRAGDTPTPASALYLEQPFDRQFRLLRLTLPAIRRVGILVGAHGDRLRGDLTAAARRSGVELHIVDVAAARNPVAAFGDALEHSEAILVFPDAEVISPNHAKWLLYMAYQQHVPVFGFSRALTDAGALAALFTTPEQAGHHAAEQVIDIVLDAAGRAGQPWRLPPPAYPRYFSVTINRAIARAFDIDTRDQRQLAQSLMSIEGTDRWQAGHDGADSGRAEP